MGLKRAFIAIAGSASAEANPSLLRRCHDFVRGLTQSVLARGGGPAIMIGGEASPTPGAGDAARLFHWTVLEEVASFAGSPEGRQRDVLAYIVTSSKAIDQIPAHRRELWDSLLASGKVHFPSSVTDWNAGAYRRQLLAKVGHALVTLGGGEGVAHLASLFIERGAPVIPLDAEIGSFYNDGLGSPVLFKDAQQRPQRFVADRRVSSGLTARLHTLSLKGDGPIDPIVDRMIALLEETVVRRVFLIRLLDQEHPDFQAVDWFMNGVVVPELKAMGYEPDQIGADLATEATIDREIFQRLHYASAVLADLTALRNNVFLELGYALGRPLPTILTAKSDTKSPFDTQAMPIHRWESRVSLDRRRKPFREFWERYIDRPPLVEPRT